MQHGIEVKDCFTHPSAVALTFLDPGGWVFQATLITSTCHYIGHMLLASSPYLVVVPTRPENCYALKELTSFRTNNFEQRLLPSRFIADSKHFRSLQALHWFRWVLSMGHLPLNSPWALQVYTRLRWMLRLKNPEQPEKEERTGKIRIKPGREKKSLSKICLSAKTVKLFFSGKKSISVWEKKVLKESEKRGIGNV